MIVPSIDLMDGRAVQLVGGRELAIDAGDPRPIAERFARVGEVAVVDLDAALGRGSNAPVIEELLEIAPCRVGGGVRTVDAALGWLDAGAERVVLGTAATPEVLRELPRERVVAALDARDGEVVVDGWRRGTGRGVVERMRALREHVGGFLVTFVECEGRMGGLPAERIAALVEAGAGAALTVAGGVREAAEIAAADRAGADVQVGMALYTGRLDLADAFTAPLRSGPDGLWPTVVADERGVALGLAYSSPESVREAIDTGRGVYHSRSRGGLWRKGATSGADQDLFRFDADCDRDCLRATVRQRDGFCHLGTRTCFGEAGGLGALAATIRDRIDRAPPGSYTARLLADPAMRRAKLLEEAAELAEAVGAPDAVHEACDVIYFALVSAAASGAGLGDIEHEFDRRARRVTRRGGGVKTTMEGGGA